MFLRELVELPEGASERPKPPKLGPRKRSNYQNDLRHWADLCGAEVSPQARELARTSTRLALQAALVAKDEGRFREYHYPVYRGRWADPQDLSSPEAIQGYLTEAGLDAKACLERAQSDEISERLDRDTKEAIERGVFGLPTIFVGDEMFWGNDRFELVRHYLQKSS